MAPIYYYYLVIIITLLPKFLRETRNTNRAMFQCYRWGPGQRNTMTRGEAFVPSRRRITLFSPAKNVVNTPWLPLSPKLVQTLTDSSTIRRFTSKAGRGPGGIRQPGRGFKNRSRTECIQPQLSLLWQQEADGISFFREEEKILCTGSLTVSQGLKERNKTIS